LSQQPWRTAHKAHDGNGAERLGLIKKRRKSFLHLVVMLRVKRTGTVRQWWRRSTPPI
jgi:hypothetical protein